MGVWIWFIVLTAAVFSAHWGAEHLSSPLKKLRKQWGFSTAAGGALVGLTSASPEIGINVTSAITGTTDIGLGAMLGSNIIAIPLMVIVAYFATRKKDIQGLPDEHKEHITNKFIKVDPKAVTVLALPYLGIILVAAVLTLPKQWRGLQPIDGWIMLAVYIGFAVQALLRGRKEGEQVEWKKKEKWLAAAGIIALGVGAYFTVKSTENISSAFGIPKLIAGLFITAPMAALPEVFATWSIARSGQVSSAVESVIGDHAVTLSVAFLPLALVTVQVKDFKLFWVNLAFVAIVPLLYSLFIHWKSGHKEHGFTKGQVIAMAMVYPVYISIILFWVLKII